MTKKILLSMPEKLYLKVEERASKNYTSLQSIIRQSIAQVLDNTIDSNSERAEKCLDR